MALNIGGVSFILVSIMVFAALSSMLLGRTLSKEEFGEFTLMRTLVLFIAPLAVWGQDVATARFFSKNDVSLFRWSQAFRTILIIGIPLLLIGVVVAAFIYDISRPRLIALTVASFCYMSTLFFSNLLRSQRCYKQAIFMLNGFRAAFFPVLVLLFFTKSLSALTAIVFYYGLIIVFAFFNARYIYRKIPQGHQAVPRHMHTTGLLFMGSQASTTLIGSLDSLFIPGMLDLASLALYQAAVVPSQIFNILGRAGKYVWIPEFGRSQNIRVKKVSIAVSLAAIFLSTAMVILAKPILHIIFDGKYDHGANVLRILTLAGAIRLFYNLGSSIIIGKMQRDALVWHLGMMVSMVVLEIGLLVLFLNHFGVIGAAWTMFIVTCLRTLASFAIIQKFKHQLHSA